jgi:serine protease Do
LDNNWNTNSLYSINHKKQTTAYGLNANYCIINNTLKGDNIMYDNNQNNQNQSNSHNGYQEYYYTAGNSTGSTVDAIPKKKKSKGGFGKKVASVVCLGLVFGVTAGAAFSVPAYLTGKQLNETKSQLEQMQSSTVSEEATVETEESEKSSLPTTSDSLSASNATYSATTTNSVEAIASSCLPSVVSITNKGVSEVRTMFGTYQQDTESSGSGIIIGENDTELLIVTNYHVVSGSNELSVVFSYDEDNDDPSVVSAKVKGYDSDKDLAVISVSLDDVTEEMRSQIKIATIGDSSSLVLGQQVVAIGNALGYGQSVTVGYISALNREVTLTDDDGGTITNKLIQTDAAINPGNSGGALLNMNGELVGINSAKVASDSVEGMGYAIPISDVQSIIENLMLKETRDVVADDAQGYIGISGTDVTSEISETYDMPMGIYVSSVSDDSPAKEAGLVKGIIITKFDGQTVKTMSELKNLLTYYKAGETVELTAQVPSSNGYDEKTYNVTLGFKQTTSDSGNSNSQQEQPSSGNDNGNGNYYSNPFGSFWNIP